MCVRIYIYIHTYAYTYIHIHTYVYTQVFVYTYIYMKYLLHVVCDAVCSRGV